ncbi:hypothetical protein F4782DRAFT_530100 [Xylaria castorea]|nr:hypothetical protein F4782DRAFT_530100 [Xylaria castorea]
MPPTIHIVCEAESECVLPNGERLRDPSLTDLGLIQSGIIRDTFPCMSQVRAIFSSPLRRAVQTARYAFEPLLSQGSMQITLRRNLLGSHGIPNNTGSPWEDLREEFGLDVDLRDLQDGWWFQVTNDIYNFSKYLAEEQARQARVHIREAARRLGDNDHIVVVSDRLFIGYLIGSGRYIADGEYRPYQFPDLFNENDDFAPLVMIDAQNQSSSSSDDWSQTTLFDCPTDPITVSSDSSYSSQTATVGSPRNPIEFPSDSSHSILDTSSERYLNSDDSSSLDGSSSFGPNDYDYAVSGGAVDRNTGDIIFFCRLRSFEP